MALRLFEGEKVTNLIFFVFWFLVFLEKPRNINGADNSKIESILFETFTRPFAATKNASENCLKNTDLYLNALNKHAFWALQMYDASAKISPGLLTGNNKHLGNYDECLRIKSDHGFGSQACIAKIEIEITDQDEEVKVSSMYEWMWCVPSSCNNSDVSESFDRRFDLLRILDDVNVTVKVNEVTCHSEESDRIVFNLEDWIYTGIILFFVAIILASTSYELFKRKNSITVDTRDPKHIMLTSFSLYTTGKNLFSFERQRNMIDCLDGIRFLSICWIIFGHTYYMEIAGINLDLAHVPKLHENWSNLLILNANIVTDTFFLMSATLLSYTLLIWKEKNPHQSLNFIQLYVHRYIRLTPAYAIVIGFYATLFYKLGSGPHWDTWVGSNSDFCRENWWTNLLYISNYINVDRTCMSQTWYLSVDMQLVWISPIFLYPMLKMTKRLFFWILFVLGLIFSVFVPFFVTYRNELPGTMLYYKGLLDTEKVFKEIYIKTYARTGPYIIGLGLGYLLHKTRSYKVSMPRMYVLSGWFLAMVAGLSSLFGPRGLYYSYDRLEASFYAGFHRQAFALAISWIIFASSQGYAGPVGKILSWRGWMPLSKLTYSAYLCHYIVLLYFSGNIRTSNNLTAMNVFRTFFGNLTMTLVLSTIICLCFEMPFLTLIRALGSKGSITSKPKTRELYKRKIVDDDMSSVSQVGTEVVNISQRSIVTICDSIDDVSIHVDHRNT